MTSICKHCKTDIKIRNLSGFCDHLYYPDYCKICKEAKEKTVVEVITLKSFHSIVREFGLFFALRFAWCRLVKKETFLTHAYRCDSLFKRQGGLK